MEEDKEKEVAAFYERLKVELDMSNTWPAEWPGQRSRTAAGYTGGSRRPPRARTATTPR